MPTRQEIFTIVATHLLRQDKRAYDLEKGICLYHAPNGLKCAVGCLISDEEYNPKMEGETASYVISEFFPRFIGEEVFLSELQRIHDRTVPESWEDELRCFAQNHYLVFPETALPKE